MNMAELRDELRGLVSGRVGIADGIAPPLLFVIVNSAWNVGAAAGVGIGTALMISVWRLSTGRSTRFAVTGLFGTVLAAFLAVRSGSAQDYFLPGIISGSLTTAIAVASVVARRPLVAWTSWLTRGWPLNWYWHPRVRPAYTRTTLIWVGFFALRTLIQWRLYLDNNVALLGLTRVALGWPALLVLLAATFVFGRRWLVALEGPSVEEFEGGTPAPWMGQPAGF